MYSSVVVPFFGTESGTDFWKVENLWGRRFAGFGIEGGTDCRLEIRRRKRLGLLEGVRFVEQQLGRAESAHSSGGTAHRRAVALLHGGVVWFTSWLSESFW